jgi:hypothetical protein
MHADLTHVLTTLLFGESGQATIQPVLIAEIADTLRGSACFNSPDLDGASSLDFRLGYLATDLFSGGGVTCPLGDSGSSALFSGPASCPL